MADDHELFREGMKRLIEAVAADIEIRGLAVDGEEAVRLAAEERPDVVLMDLQMPGRGGMWAVETLHRSHPDLPVVVLTTYDELELVRLAMRAGASGYLLKDMSGRELAEAIRKVHAGKQFVDPEIAVKLIKELPEPERSEPILAPRVSANHEARALSPRELQILGMLVEGSGNRQIAAKFGISEGTAKNYVSRIYAKLDVTDRAQAVAHAIKRGLVK